MGVPPFFVFLRVWSWPLSVSKPARTKTTSPGASASRISCLKFRGKHITVVHLCICALKPQF